jgi:hypothetical protein
VLTLVAAGAGAGVAVAAVPDGGGVITACVNVTTTTDGVTVPNAGSGPNLTIIDPSAGQHCTAAPNGVAQTTLTWNATGPQGPTAPRDRSDRPVPRARRGRPARLGPPARAG